jgi:hypothetical protein
LSVQKTSGFIFGCFMLSGTVFSQSLLNKFFSNCVTIFYFSMLNKDFMGATAAPGQAGSCACPEPVLSGTCGGSAQPAPEDARPAC